MLQHAEGRLGIGRVILVVNRIIPEHSLNVSRFELNRKFLRQQLRRLGLVIKSRKRAFCSVCPSHLGQPYSHVLAAGVLIDKLSYTHRVISDLCLGRSSPRIGVVADIVHILIAAHVKAGLYQSDAGTCRGEADCVDIRIRLFGVFICHLRKLYIKLIIRTRG